MRSSCTFPCEVRSVSTSPYSNVGRRVSLIYLLLFITFMHNFRTFPCDVRSVLTSSGAMSIPVLAAVFLPLRGRSTHSEALCPMAPQFLHAPCVYCVLGQTTRTHKDKLLLRNNNLAICTNFYVLLRACLPTMSYFRMYEATV